MILRAQTVSPSFPFRLHLVCRQMHEGLSKLDPLFTLTSLQHLYLHLGFFHEHLCIHSISAHQSLACFNRHSFVSLVPVFQNSCIHTHSSRLLLISSLFALLNRHIYVYYYPLIILHAKIKRKQIIQYKLNHNNYSFT